MNFVRKTLELLFHEEKSDWEHGRTHFVVRVHSINEESCVHRDFFSRNQPLSTMQAKTSTTSFSGDFGSDGAADLSAVPLPNPVKFAVVLCVNSELMPAYSLALTC